MILAMLGLWFLAYLILYQQIIGPLLSMNFCRRQGIDCEFVPLTGSSSIDSYNVRVHGEFYYGGCRSALGRCIGRDSSVRILVAPAL